MELKEKSVLAREGIIRLYKITNSSGASVMLSNVGAGIVSIKVPDAKGETDDVVLGYKDPADYVKDDACMCKVPGRYANRIAGGMFTLDGREYRLEKNNNGNALHGGSFNYSKRIWGSKSQGSKVVFSLESPSGDSGYPGALSVNVSYTWNEENQMTIIFEASTKAPTVLNLTNHAYFNLAGENAGAEACLAQKLQLYASQYLPTGETLIPTGKLVPVAGTPMDFTMEGGKPLGRDIREDFPALKIGKGYDNCWVLDSWSPAKLTKVARLVSETSGRVLDISTTQPAVQVYTGNYLSGSPLNPEGRPYNDYDGVAIECQNFPDAPNHPNFPTSVLRVGETYRQKIVFSFSTLGTE
ncbi:MAG: galactose mutarotase [Bacteroidales bacterium]|jgi:aldose 1-epimerase|nr:galactose mutarotase [Bacteroidales bacterium]MCI2121656.1 galactose mutarotase [Bacteroidales bacterium]MCI2144970.1 galactose mutarotase [Bacteroidales bacterium]